MQKIIAPSMLSADFGHLDNDVRFVNESAAGWFHLDIMDGTFVPNISFGFPVVKSIAKLAQKPMDAHLMIVHPEKYVQCFAELGVQYLSVHIETCEDLRGTLKLIRDCGMNAGIAINPETPAERLEGYFQDADFILVMSVHPGFGGQSFIEGSVEKVAQVRQMITASGADCFIEVDGGVGASNIPVLSQAGVSVFVAGSSIFGAPDRMAAAEQFLKLAE